MAQNVTIAGRQYSAVPAIDVPKTGGGTATFTDVTDTTAAASDVASGKYFYTARGVKTVGTSSGGGGGMTDVVTTLPGGGDLHTIIGSIDLSNDTVDARHLATGYTAHDSSGTAILGTMSGGSPNIQSLSITSNGTYTASGGVDGYSPITVSVSGGSGRTYESGTWEPSEDVANYVISFNNAHRTPPIWYAISDVTETASSTSGDNLSIVMIDLELRFGEVAHYSSEYALYGMVRHRYKSSATNAGGATIAQGSNADSSISGTRYWSTSTGIRASTNSTTRYWRAGRTYSWIAVW